MAEQILIKFEASRLGEQDLIDKTSLIATKMALPANSALIVGLPYTAVQFQGLVAAYVAARQAVLTNRMDAKALTSAKHTAELELERAGTNLARALEGRPTLTEEEVLALGFDRRSAGGPPAIVAPQDLSITFGDVSGSVSAHWQPLGGDVTYLFQYRLANTPGAVWVTGYTNTASDCRVTGLTPGALYEFQVCAIFRGVKDPGPACSVVEHRAA